MKIKEFLIRVGWTIFAIFALMVFISLLGLIGEAIVDSCGTPVEVTYAKYEPIPDIYDTV